MTSLTLEEAQATLPDLVHRLSPGDEVVITENDRPIARLVAATVELPTPKPGRCAGMLTIVSEDEEHLQGFEDEAP